ncbi:acetyltransferase [Desulfobacter hydrogenophilus]|nr:acetyltransferase [Desulfobacter hydrogenophilus]NDY74608.1 acetyltransferase [Desulfobacter hydrogenophilus]
MNKIILLGAGGAGKAILQILLDINKITNQWDIVGFLDDDIALHGKKILGFPVHDSLDWLHGKKDVSLVLIFGIPSTRKKVYDRIHAWGNFDFPAIIHPTAIIPDLSQVACGTVIYPQVVSDPDSKIGSFSLINKHSSIGHDSLINDFCVISPNSSIGGFAKIGTCCFVGMNVAIIQGITICKNVTIGAGASVVKDIDSEGTFVGVPARKISKKG